MRRPDGRATAEMTSSRRPRPPDLALPRGPVAGTYLDMVSYMTSVLLGAHAHGLGAKHSTSTSTL